MIKQLHDDEKISVFVPSSLLIKLQKSEISDYVELKRYSLFSLVVEIYFKSRLGSKIHIHFTRIEQCAFDNLLISCFRPIHSSFVTTFHWSPFLKKTSFIQRIKSAVLRILLLLMRFNGSGFICHSSETLNQLRHLKLNTRIFGYPPDIDIVREIQTQLNLPALSRKRYISLIGDLRVDKGVDLFLELVDLMPTNFNFLIAGSQDRLPQSVITEISDLQSHHSNLEVRAGFLSSELFASLLLQTQVLLLPYSSNHRGASGPLGLSSMAKTPVIVSPQPGISIPVNKYKIGLVSEYNPVAFRDAIYNLLNQSADSFFFADFNEDYSSDKYTFSLIQFHQAL